MADQGDLREALAATLTEHFQHPWVGVELHCACGKDFDGFVSWRRHVADAVLALLSDRGWVSREQDAMEITGRFAAEAALHSLVEGLERVPMYTIEGEPVYRLTAAAAAVLEAVKQ